MFNHLTSHLKFFKDNYATIQNSRECYSWIPIKQFFSFGLGVLEAAAKAATEADCREKESK